MTVQNKEINAESLPKVYVQMKSTERGNGLSILAIPEVLWLAISRIPCDQHAFREECLELELACGYRKGRWTVDCRMVIQA